MTKPLTIKGIKDMSPDEINRRWPEVARVLQGKPPPLDPESTDWSAIDLRSLPPDEINANWSAVTAEMKRRHQAKAAAKALALEEYELQRREADRQPEPVEATIGR